MATNLTDFIFTNGDDYALVGDGKIVNDSLVSTLDGDDTVEATLRGDGSEIGSAIENFNSIQTSSGNDFIIGNRAGHEGNGIFNSQDAVINTGEGSDSIVGTAPITSTAIRNQGKILMGSGSDIIINIDNGFSGVGLINESTGIINTVSGNDSIILSSGLRSGSALVNQGLITTSSGNDLIDTSSQEYSVPEILNSGTINMGKDNDTLTGALIDNSGTINMGKGSDSIEAGFIGGGDTKLGPGDDSISIGVFPGEPNFQTINGGLDFDQVEFSFGLNDDVELGIIGNVVELNRFSSIWILSRFELFIFDNESFTFEELSDL